MKFNLSSVIVLVWKSIWIGAMGLSTAQAGLPPKENHYCVVQAWNGEQLMEFMSGVAVNEIEAQDMGLEQCESEASFQSCRVDRCWVEARASGD